MGSAIQGAYFCFRAGLAMALRRLDHEGPMPALDHDVNVYKRSHSGVTLSVAITTRGRAIVAAARHAGAESPVTRAACDSFCRLVEGMPIQEAAEHGALHLIEVLRDPNEPAPVKGILTPQNCGDEFVLVEHLIRGIHGDYLTDADATPGWNQWNPKMRAEWLQRSKEEQAAGLKPIIASYIQDQGLGLDDLWISDIERGLRVILSFGPNVAATRKPALLMSLERRMRDATGNRLEVYVEEMSDENTLRRL